MSLKPWKWMDCRLFGATCNPAVDLRSNIAAEGCAKAAVVYELKQDI